MQCVHGHLSGHLGQHWHHGLCWSSYSPRPWCLRNFHHLRCHGHPLFPIILVHVYIIHIPVPCHSGSMTLQVLHILLPCSFSVKLGCVVSCDSHMQPPVLSMLHQLPLVKLWSWSTSQWLCPLAF